MSVSPEQDDFIQIPGHVDSRSVLQAQEIGDLVQTDDSQGILLNGKLIKNREFEITGINVESNLGIGRNRQGQRIVMLVCEVFDISCAKRKTERVFGSDLPKHIRCDARFDEKTGLTVSFRQTDIVVVCYVNIRRKAGENGTKLKIVLSGVNHRFIGFCALRTR